MIGVPTNIKNMYIGGDQPGEIHTVNPQGHTTISGAGYVTTSGLNLQITTTGAATVSSLANGDDVVITATLSNDAGKRMIGMPAVTIYESSIDSANSIPGGSNLAAGDYEVDRWVDWGSSDNNNIVHKTYVRNTTGTTQDIIYRINVRFLVEQGSL